MAVPTSAPPQLITTTEAAELLRVNPRTVLNWIKEDRIPYVELPGGGARREYRIPVNALLSSLAGTFKLAEAIRDWDQRAAAEGATHEKVLAEPEEEQVIERAGAALAAVARSPARVILFGSHARGEAGPGSDLDLLVIERDVPSRREERVRLRRALKGLGVPIDLIVVSEEQVEEWGEVPGTMLNAALQEGRVLVET